MKIVSLTLARNEEDILEYFVRHNCTVVDRMVITLHCCTDKSKEILMRLVHEGLPVQIQENNSPNYEQGKMMTDLMHQTDADWILPLDADEFIGGDKSPRDIIKNLSTDTVHLIPWKTYTPHSSDNNNERDPRLRITHRRIRESNPIYKVCIPGQMAQESTLLIGSHKILDTATGLKRTTRRISNLWLAHFPVRSEQQLRCKIVDGWDRLKNTPGVEAGAGFHWKNLYTRCKDPTPFSGTELQTIATAYAIKNTKTDVDLIKDPLLLKFSIFTPTHNTEKLVTAFESLKTQTYTNFEWIILLNNGTSKNDDNINTIVSHFKDAAVVKHINDISGTEDNDSIGNYKRLCCSLATGDVLVELDHDDALEPKCLEILSSHFMNSKVDFVYSSCFEYKEGESVQPFSSSWGWKYDKCLETGRHITLAFKPSPSNFGYIWYAPNHVRAWRKTFYNKIGGHDVNLDVCDDHDLCCRTYIHGNVVMEPRPLYSYYTAKGENTCYGEKNKKIQQLTKSLHDKYIEDLVLKWCNINDYKKIDLCCHNYKRSGYIGVDCDPKCSADIIFDLDTAPWPFEDNSVGVFRLQDAIEHLKDPIQTMKELWRCLVPYGWALIDVPSTDGRGAFQDPTHVSFWNSNSFWYYTKAQQAQFINTPVKFQMNRIVNHFPSKFHKLHEIVYTKAHLVKLPDDTSIPAGGREI